MATRKTASSTGTGRPVSTRGRTTRRTATTSTRRSSSGRLYPRRRASRPGLPTTVGTALGTLVVTTLLDLTWPVRIALIVVVLVIGLGYVLWRHRGEITAGGAGGDVAPDAAPGSDSGAVPAAGDAPSTQPQGPTSAPPAGPPAEPPPGV